MITGYATPKGTKKFAERSNKKLHNKITKMSTISHYPMLALVLILETQILKQTRLVENAAIKKSVLGGINVIDTAINYRAQKAERSVGNAISQLIDNNDISREEIFVSTKNGYVTNDGDIKEDLMQYVMREYGKTGIVKEGDISPGYHCMTYTIPE